MSFNNRLKLCFILPCPGIFSTKAQIYQTGSPRKGEENTQGCWWLLWAVSYPAVIDRMNQQFEKNSTGLGMQRPGLTPDRALTFLGNLEYVILRDRVFFFQIIDNISTIFPQSLYKSHLKILLKVMKYSTSVKVIKISNMASCSTIQLSSHS